MAKMDNAKTQHRILKAIRQTGSFSQGYMAGGVSEATFRRYRDAYPEFDSLCMDAQQFFNVQRSIRFGWKIMRDAKKFLHDEIEAGTCPHAIAYKIAYEQDNEVLG